MKKIFQFALFAAAIATSSFARAGEIPDCWTQPNVVPGEFIINIETKEVTKEQLLLLLEKATGFNIQAKKYPIVGSQQGYVAFEVEQVDYGTKKMTPQELREAVKKELQPFSDTRGVTIECNGLMFPAGMR